MHNAKYSGNNTSPSNVDGALIGWVLESPGRGSLGLILTCLTTIFLCTWIVIHPRVCRRRHLHGFHKAVLLTKTILAPEFIAVEGLQEWSQAQKMVRSCFDMTGGCFKLVHAFYIGMLALRYRTPQGEKIIWPNQYTWLLEQGLIKWEDHALWGLSEENIRDKSNADGTAKLLALGQVSWFVAQSIMRCAHHLPLSQLETMTLSYIPLFAVTYFFWWVKPKDVMTPSIVDLPSMLPEQRAVLESLAVSNIFDDEATRKQDSLWTVFALTRRVFEKEAEDRAMQEAQQKIRPSTEKKITQKQPQKQIPPDGKRIAMDNKDERFNQQHGHSASGAPEACMTPAKEIVVAYWDPELYHSKMLWPFICLFGASFGAFHLLSWNAVFPTYVEQWLWRAAALVSIFSMLIFMQFEKVVLRCGGPLSLISLASPVFYCLSRLVMIGGVVAAFRASDPAIYETYDVSTYWIHIL